LNIRKEFNVPKRTESKEKNLMYQKELKVKKRF